MVSVGEIEAGCFEKSNIHPFMIQITHVHHYVMQVQLQHYPLSARLHLSHTFLELGVGRLHAWGPGLVQHLNTLHLLHDEATNMGNKQTDFGMAHCVVGYAVWRLSAARRNESIPVYDCFVMQLACWCLQGIQCHTRTCRGPIHLHTGCALCVHPLSHDQLCQHSR